jgi:hypothetical protein
MQGSVRAVILESRVSLPVYEGTGHTWALVRMIVKFNFWSVT